MNWLKQWWCNHVQRTLGTVIVLFAGADLTTLTAYQQDLAHFFGSRWTAHVLAASRLLCGAAIIVRAMQARKP
jgi:hypothetical protein